MKNKIKPERLRYLGIFISYCAGSIIMSLFLRDLLAAFVSILIGGIIWSLAEIISIKRDKTKRGQN